MIGKHAAMGESMITIYRIMLVTLVTVIVLGVSVVAYDYEVNTRDTDAMLIARAITECVSVNGIFDPEVEDIFSFCGFDKSVGENIFVSLEIMDEGESIYKVTGGDESLIWVKRIYTSNLKTTSIDKYEPGYFNGVFPVAVLKDDRKIKAEMLVEVIIKNE